MRDGWSGCAKYSTYILIHGIIAKNEKQSDDGKDEDGFIFHNILTNEIIHSVN